VVSRTWLWLMIVLFALFQILVLATFFVLGPVMADRELGGAGAWAAIMTAWGVGAVAGAALGLRFDPERPLLACNAIVILVVPAMVLLGMGAPTWAIAVAASGAGLAMSLGGVIYDTAFQRHVPDDVLSRAAAYDWMGSMALRPLGYAVVGPVAAAIGVGATLEVAGALTAVLMAGSLAVPAIRDLGRHPV
jgi:hypothetical protein